MTFELAVKILANGFIFTPNAVVRDVGGVMTLFIYIVSFLHIFLNQVFHFVAFHFSCCFAVFIIISLFPGLAKFD